MLYYFAVRKYTIKEQPGGEWYDVRTKDSWVSMIHEEDTSIEEGVMSCCMWSATQQGAEQGPVWPIAHAFKTAHGAAKECKRQKKTEPNYEYQTIEVSASVFQVAI